MGRKQIIITGEKTEGACAFMVPLCTHNIIRNMHAYIHTTESSKYNKTMRALALHRACAAQLTLQLCLLFNVLLVEFRCWSGCGCTQRELLLRRANKRCLRRKRPNQVSSVSPENVITSGRKNKLLSSAARGHQSLLQWIVVSGRAVFSGNNLLAIPGARQTNSKSAITSLEKKSGTFVGGCLAQSDD